MYIIWIKNNNFLLLSMLLRFYFFKCLESICIWSFCMYWPRRIRSFWSFYLCSSQIIEKITTRTIKYKFLVMENSKIVSNHVIVLVIIKFFFWDFYFLEENRHSLAFVVPIPLNLLLRIKRNNNKSKQNIVDF